MSETRYPYGYGTGTYTMTQLRARYEPKMHPEYARRLFAWIEAQGGRVGIGSGWRADGGQPDAPGYAPEGKSFHQNQRFKSGRIAYCAVDLVHVNPGGNHRTIRWSEVPEPGSARAVEWGLHCNVGGEPWHMQPTEIRGWLTWVLKLRPEPKADYPIPGGKPSPTPTPEPDPDPITRRRLSMFPELVKFYDDGDVYIRQPGNKYKTLLGEQGVEMEQFNIAEQAEMLGYDDATALKLAAVRKRSPGMAPFTGIVANPPGRAWKRKHDQHGRRK